MERGESCPLRCTNKRKQRAENSLLALFGFSSEQDDLFRSRNLHSEDNLSLALSSWLRYSLNDMSLRQSYVPTGMAQYQQQQLLQKRQQLQRPHPMSLPQEHPLMAQQQQQLQRQQLLQQQLQQQQQQQQQCYFAQLQPQIGAVYNPRSWLPYHNQQPSNPQGNYQYWYGRPQPVNIPKAVPLHPELIPPSFCQHSNGAYNQHTATPKPESKPAMKARSPAAKDQAQPTVLQGRPMAGGRSNFRPQSSNASDSLNRINSLTSFQDESGSRFRDSEEDMIKYRRIAARTLSPEIEELDRRQKSLKLQKDKQLQEEKIKEDELDSSLGSGASSLFRRLAHFMRCRSLRKSKMKSAKTKSHDEVSQISSVFSAPKKRGFLRRFFGEVRDGGSDIGVQQQAKSVSSVHYPTDIPTNNRDQEELREAEYFRRVRKRQQRRKLGDIYRMPAEHQT